MKSKIPGGDHKALGELKIFFLNQQVCMSFLAGLVLFGKVAQL